MIVNLFWVELFDNESKGCKDPEKKKIANYIML